MGLEVSSAIGPFRGWVRVGVVLGVRSSGVPGQDGVFYLADWYIRALTFGIYTVRWWLSVVCCVDVPFLVG